MLLKVHLDAEPDADASEVAELARNLRMRLLELDVEQVEPARGTAPAGSKTGDLATWQTLLVTLAASGGVLTTVISGINGWLSQRREPTSVVIEVDGDSITLPNATAEERMSLINMFLERHGQS